MSKILLAFLLMLFSSNKQFLVEPAYKRFDSGLAVLRQQVLKDILAETVNDKMIMNWSGTMKPDGSWADINYADKTRGAWTVSNHLARLNNMAVLYKNAGTKWTGNASLQNKIILGLEFWFKNDFICPNWWYPEIGVPKLLGPTMLLMEDKLTPSQKQAGIKILSRSTIGMTGQNKVWLSGNVVYRSLLTGNVDSIRAAVSAIQGEVVISENEGIQPDYSYHQHGPQQQFGNYGSSYAGDMLKWASIFQNTPFQFEPAKIEILRNYLLKGMRWIIWKDKMDISACGRQLFPEAQAGKATIIKGVLNKMPLVDAAYKERYVTAMDDFSGNIHFWKSDMTIHRRNNFYTSVKMSSRRVGGAESCNEENIQGYHLGDGATYFYQSGEEYTDIFPFWDWKKIPGTTTFHDAVPLPMLPCSGYHIESDFVGGVSDGANGIATLAYYRDSLYAQKSWFYFDDEIVCLGAGIHSDIDKPVTTTVNQSFLHGKVMVKQAAAAMTLESGQHELPGVSWVIHDNWGYYFPDKADIELTNRQQSGDWNKVLKRMPAEEIKANMFTLWFNHRVKPQAARYAYFVFPAATAENIDARASSINIVENSEKLQVIESMAKQMTGYVFVQPGEAKSKIVKRVSADKSCVLMINKKNARLDLTLSDPTHLQDKIIIGLQGKKKIQIFDAVYDSGKDMTYVTVVLPQGFDAGKTVQFTAE